MSTFKKSSDFLVFSCNYRPWSLSINDVDHGHFISLFTYLVEKIIKIKIKTDFDRSIKTCSCKGLITKIVFDFGNQSNLLFNICFLREI